MFHERPNWIDITDLSIYKSVEKYNKRGDIHDENIFSCIRHQTTIHIDHEKRSYYDCVIYALTTPSICEGASIQEEFLSEDSYLLIHTIGIVRGTEYIDKKNDSIIRVFNHEGQSSSGIIHNQRKVNIIIQDLQKGDIFIYERTIISPIRSEKILEQKYFYDTYSLPRGFWSHQLLDFTLLNETEFPILGHYQYFNNFPGEEGRNQAIEDIAPHTKFSFYKENYILQNDPKTPAPLLNFATKADWNEIGSDIFSLYRELLDTKVDPITLSDIDLEGESKDIQIQKAIEFVQNQITYIYDSDFMDGTIPQAYQQTLKTKQGDCKAKSLLLYKILQHLEIQAEIILVNYTLDNAMDMSIPSPFIFNHAILRIIYNDKEYFIDPTIKNESGMLAYRHQPLFERYFPIRWGSKEVIKREILGRENFFYEESMEILEKTNTINTTVTWRYGLADNYRNNLLYFGKKKLIESDMDFLLKMLEIDHDEQDIASHFIHSDIHKIVDNPSTNTIIMEGTYVLKDIHTSAKKNFIKCYPGDINKPVHNMCDFRYKFFLYSFRRTISIKTDRKIITKTEPTTTRNTHIENQYFSYTNHKTFKRKEIIVNTQLSIKKVGSLDNDEFHILEASVNQILESNNGIGLHFSEENRMKWLWWLGFLFIIWWGFLFIAMNIYMALI